MKINVEMTDKEKQTAIKILIAVVAVIAILATVITLVIVNRNKKSDDGNENSNSNSVTIQAETKRNEEGSNSGTDTTSASAQTKKEEETGSMEQTKVTFDAVKSKNWDSGDKFYNQYDITIKNDESKEIAEWKLEAVLPNEAEISQQWNCEINKDGNKFYATPVEYNKKISSGATIKDIGIVICFGARNEEPESLAITVIFADGTEFTINKEGKIVRGSYNNNSGETKAPDNDSNKTETTEAATEAATEANTEEKKQPVAPVGALHVKGTQLVDANDNPVQLKGVSTHGISWFPDYVNYDAFKTLKDDWGINVVRIAMYPAEYNGYLNGGNQDELKKIIDTGVDAATKLGLYVIIDWHVLNYSPSQYTSQAQTFFEEMTKKYSNYDNVIYEICNEPVGADWNSQIKPYAESVLSTIRSNDKDAVVICGTNTWSQDVDAVVGNKLDDENVMYALHFYAATHKDSLRNKLTTAINGGVPVFVSECSICDASGNGGIDYDSANAWLDLMNKNNVSFIAWSLCNKAETSALINSGCSKLSGWSDDDLSETGKWFKKAIKGE